MEQIRGVLGDAFKTDSGAPTTRFALEPTDAGASWPERRADLPPSRAEVCSMRPSGQLEEMIDAKSWNCQRWGGTPGSTAPLADFLLLLLLLGSSFSFMI